LALAFKGEGNLPKSSDQQAQSAFGSNLLCFLTEKHYCPIETGQKLLECKFVVLKIESALTVEHCDFLA